LKALCFATYSYGYSSISWLADIEALITVSKAIVYLI